MSKQVVDTAFELAWSKANLGVPSIATEAERMMAKVMWNAALKESIKQRDEAKREALLEAADWLDEQLLYEGHGVQLRRMAKEMK